MTARFPGNAVGFLDVADTGLGVFAYAGTELFFRLPLVIRKNGKMMLLPDQLATVVRVWEKSGYRYGFWLANQSFIEFSSVQEGQLASVLQLGPYKKPRSGYRLLSPQAKKGDEPA